MGTRSLGHAPGKRLPSEVLPACSGMCNAVQSALSRWHCPGLCKGCSDQKQAQRQGSGVRGSGESPPSMGPPAKAQAPASAVRVQTAKSNWLRTFPETKIALAKGRGASGCVADCRAQPPSCPRFYCHLRARPLGYLHQRCTGRGIMFWPLWGPPPEAGSW